MRTSRLRHLRRRARGLVLGDHASAGRPPGGARRGPPRRPAPIPTRGTSADAGPGRAHPARSCTCAAARSPPAVGDFGAGALEVLGVRRRLRRAARVRLRPRRRGAVLAPGVAAPGALQFSPNRMFRAIRRAQREPALLHRRRAGVLPVHRRRQPQPADGDRAARGAGRALDGRRVGRDDASSRGVRVSTQASHRSVERSSALDEVLERPTGLVRLVDRLSRGAPAARPPGRPRRRGRGRVGARHRPQGLRAAAAVGLRDDLRPGQHRLERLDGLLRHDQQGRQRLPARAASPRAGGRPPTPRGAAAATATSSTATPSARSAPPAAPTTSATASAGTARARHGLDGDVRPAQGVLQRLPVRAVQHPGQVQRRGALPGRLVRRAVQVGELLDDLVPQRLHRRAQLAVPAAVGADGAALHRDGRPQLLPQGLDRADPRTRSTARRSTSTTRAGASGGRARTGAVGDDDLRPRPLRRRSAVPRCSATPRAQRVTRPAPTAAGCSSSRRAASSTARRTSTQASGATAGHVGRQRPRERRRSATRWPLVEDLSGGAWIQRFQKGCIVAESDAPRARSCTTTRGRRGSRSVARPASSASRPATGSVIARGYIQALPGRRALGPRRRAGVRRLGRRPHRVAGRGRGAGATGSRRRTSSTTVTAPSPDASRAGRSPPDLRQHPAGPVGAAVGVATVTAGRRAARARAMATRRLVPRARAASPAAEPRAREPSRAAARPGPARHRRRTSPPARTRRPSRSAAARTAGVTRGRRGARPGPRSSGWSVEPAEEGGEGPRRRGRRGGPRQPLAPVPGGPAPRRSSAARRAASPRRANGGGSVARTSPPASTSWAPGSRSTTRSPTSERQARLGEGEPGVVPRRAGAPAPASTSCRRGGTAWAGSRSTRRWSSDVEHLDGAGTRPGSRVRCRGGRAEVRHGAQVHREPGRPGRAVDGGAVDLQAAHPHRAAPPTSRTSPRPGPSPSGSVPVTTVPTPVTVNERSTQSRTGAAGSAAGAASASGAQGGAHVVEAGPGAGRHRRRAPRARCRAAPAARGRRRGRGRRVGEVGLGHDERDRAQPEGAHGGDVLLGLGLPPLVGRDDEQHPGGRAEPGEGGADEPVVPGHVDEGDPRARRRRPRRGRARWSCRGAAPRAAGRGRFR